MNSKILQDKVREIEEDAIEMRLLKKSDKNLAEVDYKGKDELASSQSTVSLKHYDQLLCDFRCPGCTTPLQAPIYLCFNGHSICTICRITMKSCPICQEQVSGIRSFTLERLSGKFQFPCKNLRNGCQVRLPMELMKWHEGKCIFKKTSCFMGKIWHDCDWTGRENEWLQHCQKNHSQKILQNQDQFELTWNYETLKDNSGPIIAYYLIKNFGETFNLYQIHEAKHKQLTWTIILANHKEASTDKMQNVDLPQFAFEFEFHNKKDSRFLLVQRFPVHYEDSDAILDDGKCVKITLNDIQRFLDDDKNLFYRIKIISMMKRDRWDQILEGPKSLKPETDNFSFFDSEDDKVFMDDEKIVVVTDRKHSQKNDDYLRQIFDKEFIHPNEETKLIQKPPRKSLEHLNKRNSSNFTSHSSPFD